MRDKNVPDCLVAAGARKGDETAVYTWALLKVMSRSSSLR